MRDVVIYTTAGGAHGLGHVKRMYTLATVLQSHGAQVSFASSTPDAVAAEVSKCFSVEGFEYHDACYIFDTKEYWSEEEFHELRIIGHVVRMDHPHAMEGTADLVILPGVHYAQADITRVEQAVGKANVLYGAEYVMLSPEVAALQPLPWDARKDMVLYCVGGTDAHDAARWFDEAGPSQIDHAYHVCGPFANRAAYLHCLSTAKLVVSLFGVTTYEALYLRVPLILCGTTAENIAACSILTERYGIRYGGEVHGLVTPYSTSLSHVVQMCWKHIQEGATDRWQSLHIDNQGATRVADAILPLLQT